MKGQIENQVMIRRKSKPRWCSGLSCSPVEAATRVQIPVGAPKINVNSDDVGLFSRIAEFYASRMKLSNDLWIPSENLVDNT